jgi:WD40 repeat protein/Tfp pilus assembly protein PilF
VKDSLSSSDLLTAARPKHPYPGLRPFDHNEWSIFFGREQMIDDVIERLAAHHLVLIHGSSGSGKSSLVRAGVLPKLARQHLRAGAPWLTCSIRPSGGPLWNLAKEFARLEGTAGDVKRVGEIMAEFSRRGATLASVAGSLKEVQGRRLCLLVDQFEELFRYEKTSREEAELFVELLVGVDREVVSASAQAAETADQATAVHVVVTMRSEFLGECTRFKGLAEAINRTQYLVPGMDRDALLRAIRRPALLYGGEVSLRLAERMIADVGGREDALPLIQHGLMYLWNAAIATLERDEKLVLDVGQLESAGSLVNLLSNHADSVVSRAAPDAERRRAVEDLFRALTDLNVEGRAIRRPQAFRDLVAVTACQEDTLRVIIDALRADGVSFLTPFGDEPIVENTPIDISHEALIRCWRRLADPKEGWLKQEFDDGLIWRSLVVEAKAFEANPQHALTPATTDERSKWWQKRRPNEHWAARYDDNFDLVGKLLEASRNAAQRIRREAEQRERAQFRERLRWRLQLAGLGVFLVVLGVAGYAMSQRYFAVELREKIATLERDFAMWEARNAREERERAMKDREEAMEQRRRAVTNLTRYVARLSNEITDRGDPGSGMLLALEPGPYEPETEDALSYGYQRLQEIAMLRGHENGVTGIAFHPDGKRVATASLDRTARLWDVATGAEIRVMRGHESNLRSIAFSPDGRYLLTASDDRTARLWDTETGRQLRVFRGHFGAVRKAIFSPNGRSVATVSNDKTARVWETDTGKLIADLRGHEQDIWGVAFSPDGNRLLTASDDKTARMWNLETRESAIFLKDQEPYFNNVAFSPDGRHVATVSTDSLPRLWGINGQPIRVFRGHEGAVLSVAFHGNLLLTTSADRSVRLWDVQTGGFIAVLRGHDGEVQDADISPDGRILATASLDGTARLWDRHLPRGIAVLGGFGAKVWSAAFSPDGKQVLTASADQTARLWDVDSGREIRVLRGHQAAVFGAAFAPDGKWVATASGDNTASIWDVATGQQLTVLRGHTSLVISAEFDPDGKYVVTASYDKTARLWEAATGRQIRVFSGHEQPVIHAAFSPDGKRVVTASDDRTARIWSTESGDEILALRGHKDRIWYAAFGPDGRQVVTGSLDKTAQLWDAETGAPLRGFDGHQGSVYSAVFSPDGRRLVTASLDKTARIWDVATGRLIGTLRGHGDAVAHAVFSGDGRRVVTSSQDATARLWRVFPSMEELSAAARSAIPRCLTRAQRVAAYLDPAPPAWCIEQGKWPYHTQAWKDWLRYSQQNPGMPLPDQAEWYDAAIRMAPDNPAAYFDRGNQFFDKRDYDRAIADYAKAIELDPAKPLYAARSAEAYYRRGELFFEKLDYDRAIADYAKAIELDPDNRNYRTRSAEAYYRRGNAAFGRQDYERALSDYVAALRLDPANPGYRSKRDNTGTIVDSGEAIKRDPNDAAAFGRRAAAYLAERDYDRAVADYTAAARLDSAGAGYRTGLARAYYERGHTFYDRRDYHSAIADYSEAIRLEPTAQRFNSRCWARAIVGELQPALADCNEALKLEPAYANALDSRAFAYLKLGELDNAIADYDAALKLDPRNEYSLYGRGIARLKKGDEQGGSADIDAAKKIRATIVDDFVRFGVK